MDMKIGKEKMNSMSKICSVCGQEWGKCIDARDAGNFLIPTFKTPEGPSHWIHEDDLHLYDTRPRAIMIGKPRLVYKDEIIG